MKISILIGHGKNQYGKYDPGACYNGYEEFKIVRYIGQRIYDILKNTNCDIELVNFNGEMSLIQRISKFKNDIKTDLILELHLNAGQGTGTEVYYYDGDKLGNQYATEISRYIAKTFNIRDRGAKKGIKFGIIRETKPRALLLECCFIDSADLELIKTLDGQNKMGQAIAESLIKIFNLKFKITNIYKVQCGAFSKKENAIAMTKKLLSMNIKSYILPQNNYYRVIVGEFDNEQAAYLEAKRLRNLGFDTIVKKII